MAAQTTTSPLKLDFLFMLIGLYFILISFFIILATMSVNDNEKLQNAVNSIAQVFKLDDRIAVRKQASEPNSYAVFLEELQGWIAHLYALGDVSIVRRGNQIAITLKHPRFFEPESVQFTEDAGRALQALSELFAAWQVEYLSEIEVVADEPESQSSDAVQSEFRGAGHAAAIASYLTAHGVSSNSLSVSMSAHSEPMLAFTFIIRIPPKVNDVK